MSLENTIKCWGYNGFGQLGYGNTLPTSISLNNLSTINLGNNFLINKINVGSYHTCAISTINTIKCWGYNIFGQLGYGDNINRGNNINDMGNNLTNINLGNGFIPKDISIGGYSTCVISINNNIKCFGSNSYGILGYDDTLQRGDNINQMGNNLPYLFKQCTQSPTLVTYTPTLSPTIVNIIPSISNSASSTTLEPTEMAKASKLNFISFIFTFFFICFFV